MGIFLTEKSFYEYEDQYKVNDLYFFKLSHYKPEISGWYECLFSPNSSIDKSIKSGFILPYIYYDQTKDSWYFDYDKPEERRTIHTCIIGWRDYMIGDSDTIES